MFFIQSFISAATSHYPHVRSKYPSHSQNNSANPALQGILNKNNNFGFNNLTVAEFRKIQWSYF
jgi:hypothetical protein